MVNVMGFGWEEVHNMVENMERSVEDRLVDRMDEMTGHPQRCPHGEPIPSKKRGYAGGERQTLERWAR